MATPFWSGLLDGLTGGGLLHGLCRPGAATQLFADPGGRSLTPSFSAFCESVRQVVSARITPTSSVASRSCSI
jgi:hypothetical protein